MVYIALNDRSKPWWADHISPVEAVAERAATVMAGTYLFRATYKYSNQGRLIFSKLPPRSAAQIVIYPKAWSIREY